MSKRIEHLIVQDRVVMIVSILVLVMFVVSISHWSWQWFAPVEPLETSTLASGNDGNRKHQAPLSADLLGRSVVTERAPDIIPLSSFNLVLTGAMVMPVGSFALISTNGGPEEPYTVGQNIVDGVVLHAVYADRVLIRRAGGTESLILIRRAAPTSSGGPITMGSEPTPEIVTMIPHEESGQPMQKPAFLRQAHMVPNTGGGFLVKKIRPESPYMQAGLRAGDVITSVNGRAVNSMDDIMNLYQQLENNKTSQVSIGIQRAGENEILR